MKILVFTGGLGNQIFEYAFFLHLKSLFPKQHFYGHYGKKLKEHYGLELNRWFDIELPPEKWWTLPVVALFYFYKQVFPNSKWLDLNQREWKHKEAKVFFPFKFSKAYFPKADGWLRWKVDESKLCLGNKETLQKIRSGKTCFVHVRRGDYLAPAYKELFEGCCDVTYYQRALDYIRQQAEDVKFVCFSDDIAWAKANLNLDEDTIFVNWNTGTDSPLDMYLMSQCQYGIIANSTFSYWGAFLGKKKDIVVHPAKWWNHKDGNPDIIPDNWLGM